MMDFLERWGTTVSYLLMVALLLVTHGAGLW